MSTPLNGSVMKAFALLELFSEDRGEVTAAEAARETGLTVATAHRFLLTLERAGALTSARRGHFRLGPRLAELGRLAETTDPVVARALPLIRAAARELNESVMACRLGPAGPRCIAVASADRPISVNISVGTSLDMAKSAQGKLFLADMSDAERSQWGDPGAFRGELDAVRTAGFAQNRGETEPDIGAVAVPVRDTSGQTRLTLSAFGLLSRFDKPSVARATRVLAEAARQLVL